MKPKIIKAVTISLILVFCSALAYYVISTLPAKTADEPGAVLFEDDFSKTPNGWGTMGRTGGEIGFEYQGLVISVDVGNYLFWTVNGGKYADSRIEVDAVLLDGPTDDNFGVICRFEDNENFYGFLVSHDGYYGVFKMQEGTMVLASPDGNLQYSEAIRRGGVVNHIDATCIGNLLRLKVNDTLLAEVQDPTFAEGKIGLIAGAYEYSGVKILFDNLKVSQP